MIEMKTLVYFDIEATGLKSSGRPRISEISFVAINTQEILNLNHKLLEKLNDTKSPEHILDLETFLPRVLNKLTLCVYPMATIMPEVSKLTGLDNYNLIDQSRFDKRTGDLLKAFLSRLPFPVCLVAHNGNLYDFPLLQAELVKTGIELGSDIFCVDSYVGLKEIFKNSMNKPLAVEAKPAERENLEEKTVEKEMQYVKILLETGEFDKEMDAVEEKSIALRQDLPNEQSIRIDHSNMLIGKKENEQTPLKNGIPLSSIVLINKRKQWQSTEVFKSKKKLKFSECEYPKSFSLINLHKQLLGYLPTISHGAEADCLALLRITAVIGDKWLVWVKNNSSPFSETKSMWTI